ncbi:hypothetical protein [Acidovorax sp.]|uniref:hypothetical protein n=1 Tax=Acidovorax sp. TaxID=1872122 RepID=UPI0025C20BBF|nr:hypothetical protein [Acidovorax sp.]
MRFMVFGDRSEMQKRPECQGDVQERLSLNAPAACWPRLRGATYRGHFAIHVKFF